MQQRSHNQFLITRPTAIRTAILLLFTALVLLADQILVLPDNLFGRSVQNALHIPTFFALTVLLHFLFRSWRLLTLLLVALSAGVALELTQTVTARDASAADLLRNLLGIALGLCAVSALRARVGVMMAVATALVLISAAMPARVLLAYHYRDLMFPQLLAPDLWQLNPLLTGRTDFAWQLPAAAIADLWPSYADRKVLQLTLNQDRYPGVTLQEVDGDWRAFESLKLQFFVDGTDSLDLTVAVGHVGTPGTARFISSSFPGGANVWNIPIEVLLSDGSIEPRISHLIVHSSPDYAGASILLAEIKLTRRN